MTMNLNSILNNPEESVRQTTDPLAKLFRHILADTGVGVIEFYDRLNAYLMDPSNGIPEKDRSSTKGNRIKELARDKLTWDLLMKGLVILAPEHVDVSIAIRWREGHTTYHSVGMPIKTANQSYQVETSNGKKVTTMVPPMASSRWASILTGPSMDTNDHVNITYTVTPPTEAKG